MSLIGHAFSLLRKRNILSKISLRKALRQSRAGSYLCYSSLAFIKMDVPTPDPRNDLLSSGFCDVLVSRSLCAFGRVATVIFIAILWGGCEARDLQETTLHEEGNSSWTLVLLYDDQYLIHGADLDTCLQWARSIELYLANNIIDSKTKITKRHWQKRKIVLNAIRIF